MVARIEVTGAQRAKCDGIPPLGRNAAGTGNELLAHGAGVRVAHPNAVAEVGNGAEPRGRGAADYPGGDRRLRWAISSSTTRVSASNAIQRGGDASAASSLRMDAASRSGVRNCERLDDGI